MDGVWYHAATGRRIRLQMKNVREKSKAEYRKYRELYGW